MTEIFKFGNHEVRFMNTADDPWWVATDIHEVLGISCKDETLRELGIDETTKTYSSYDLLAIAIERSCEGEIDKAEKIFKFVGASILSGIVSSSLERIYFACRIFHAWSKEQEKKEDAKRTECVYLIGCKNNQSMKIGVTTNVAKRLVGLQVSSPFKLELLATVRGGRTLETKLHKEFESSRLSGEWFSWSEDILAKFQHIYEAQELQ